MWNWSKNYNRQAVLRLFANKIEISRRFVDSSKADNWRAQCYHYHHYLGLPRPPSTRPLHRLRQNFCQIFSKIKLKLTSTNLNWAFDLIEYILVTFKRYHSSISWIQTAVVCTVVCYQSIIYTMCFFISRPYDNVNAAVRIGTERW